MLDWALSHSETALKIAAAVASFGVFWLALRTARRGSAGLIADVLVPGLLAGLTFYYLPEVMSACGVGSTRYQLALEGLFFRSLWLGLMLDQASWVQLTTGGLRGRRAGLPVLVWGLGFVALMLAPWMAQGQEAVLAKLNQAMEGPDMQEINLSELPALLSDWGLRVAQLGIALILVGAFALAMQSLLWTIRIAHAYVFTQAVDPDDPKPPAYAPGCFQWLFGFVFGVAGTIMLVWATFDLLRNGT